MHNNALPAQIAAFAARGGAFTGVRLMIYIKTELGQTALQNRALALTPRQRSAFILFDGKRDSIEVLKATSGLGVTNDDLNHLVALGLLAPGGSGFSASGTTVPAPLAPAAPVAPSASSGAALSQTPDGRPTLSAQAHYSKAYPIATRLTASLGLRGFRLNLAVEAAGDLDKLKELAPKIREAVGPEKFLELENALYY
jgi:hypothetical protein